MSPNACTLKTEGKHSQSYLHSHSFRDLMEGGNSKWNETGKTSLLSVFSPLYIYCSYFLIGWHVKDFTRQVHTGDFLRIYRALYIVILKWQHTCIQCVQRTTACLDLWKFKYIRKKKVQNNPVPHFVCCNYVVLKICLIKAHVSWVEGFLTVQNFKGKFGKRNIIPDIQTVWAHSRNRIRSQGRVTRHAGLNVLLWLM